MKNIPKQLQKMRFCRVGRKDKVAKDIEELKRAFETGWQKNPYTFKQIHQFFPKENYGIICGQEIRGLDDD